MEYVKKLIEYYDELFPLTEDQKKFFNSLTVNNSVPTKFLHIGCATGSHVQYLAETGSDVTGIDQFQDFINRASLRRRTQLQSVRYFYMMPMEISRFLGKNFYDVVLSLNNQIILTHDEILMKKYFFDVKNALKAGGKFVINLTNFQNYDFGKKPVELPERKSIRSSLDSEAWKTETGEYMLSQKLETGNGRILDVMEGTKILPITTDDISSLAKEAGFKSVMFYEDFALKPWSNSSQDVLAILEA